MHVFSFGILMLVLLTGRRPFLVGSNGRWDDPIHLLEYVKDLREKGEPVEFGALRCCEERNEDTPKMILVAKEIKLIETRII
ncbi:unnamed protein product [Brassica oleracea var. botrytis]|uniref:Uncharacterized protein n=1 Tax=Brassica oleracea TaxID=3712 RepID=A0A3P6FV47_BRAOL|nr:unnamed protein product [Brassica oleracea]